MAISDLIEQTIAQHIIAPRVISYAPSKLNEVTGRFVSSNRVYNFVLNKSGVSYSPAGQGDSLLFSALYLRQDAVRKAKVGNDRCNAGKSYQCGKICLGNRRKCHKGVRDVNDARRIASILESTNEKLKGSLEGSDKAKARGKALFEARKGRVEKPKANTQKTFDVNQNLASYAFDKGVIPPDSGFGAISPVQGSLGRSNSYSASPSNVMKERSTARRKETKEYKEKLELIEKEYRENALKSFDKKQFNLYDAFKFEDSKRHVTSSGESTITAWDVLNDKFKEKGIQVPSPFSLNKLRGKDGEDAVKNKLNEVEKEYFTGNSEKPKNNTEAQKTSDPTSKDTSFIPNVNSEWMNKEKYEKEGKAVPLALRDKKDIKSVAGFHVAKENFVTTRPKWEGAMEALEKKGNGEAMLVSRGGYGYHVEKNQDRYNITKIRNNERSGDVKTIPAKEFERNYRWYV